MDQHQLRDTLDALDRAQAALRLIGPGRRAVEVEHTVSAIGRELRTIKGSLDAMTRRDVLKSFGVLGVPALAPAAAVRDALMSTGTQAPSGTQASPQPNASDPLPSLKAQVHELWNARQSCRYQHLGFLAPRVLANLQGRPDPESQALLSLSYQAIAGAMSKLGKSDLAWVASERAVAAAENSGDSLMVAAAPRRLAHAYLSEGRDLQSANVVLSAADSITPDSPRPISVYGSLLNSAAIAASRVDEHTDAKVFLDEAESVARRLGYDANHYYLGLGPTNVILHRVSVAVDAGDAGRALEYSIPVDSIPLAERKARYLIDLSQAHADHRSYDQATERLLDAEAIAPEEVLFQPSVKVLVHEMLRHSNHHNLAALAVRAGIE